MADNRPNSESGSRNDTSLDQTVQTLKNAIESNRKIQAEIARQVLLLSEEKAENRRQAAQIYSHIAKLWQCVDEHKRPSPPEDLPNDNLKEIVKLEEEEEEEEEENNQNEGKLTKRRVTAAKIRKTAAKWRYDPYRRWTRRFFIDPNGDTPLPNEETNERRRLEEDKFFHRTCPPWSKKETSALITSVKELQQQQQQDDGTEGDPESATGIDFQKASTMTRKKMEKVRIPVIPNRSAEECKLWYEGQTNNTSPLTKNESLQIMEQVHLNHGNPSWHEIPLPSARTPWECFVAYQSRLSGSGSKSTWTSQQDELLLKYLAAMGPQYVLHMEAAAELSSRFFPDKTPKVIMARANASQLNPNVSRESWTDEENRKVVLCMKVYRDEQPNPLARAAVHFPNRMSRSINEKWHRSLNPMYTSIKPFAKEEDEALLSAIGSTNSNNKIGWAELAKQFPGRHPRTIQNRWTELVGSDELVKKYKIDLKKKSVRRGGSLVDEDVFVVRVKASPSPLDTANS